MASYPILLFMRIPHSIYTALLTLLCLSTLEAQTYYRGEEPSCTTQPDSTALLSLHVVGEGFFRNDEYASDLVADYTLPGYRLHTALAYRPTTHLPVELRLGLYHLYYWGATRYPAGLAYQDLPYWRGDGADYTRLRLLPSFRASIQPAPGWAVLLGQLQGGTKHRLLEPLYNPELQLTADPEVGLQIRYEGQQSRLDTWIDWQSFIFGGAQHPEAFVFGLSTSHTFTLRPSQSLEVVAQATAHHRGGVLNERPDTVHTWLNTALGAVYHHSIALPRHPLHLHAGLYALGYSQRGEHYASDKGWGWLATAGLSWGRWESELSHFEGHDFISPLGIPFAQSVGRAGPKHLLTHYPRYTSWQGSYRIIEAKDYTFGVSGGVYIHPHSSHTMSSFLEVYLSIAPHFTLLSRQR